MITKIQIVIDKIINLIHPQSRTQPCFAWQSEFLFIQEKSRLTLAPIGRENSPQCNSSPVPYDTYIH